MSTQLGRRAKIERAVLAAALYSALRSERNVNFVGEERRDDVRRDTRDTEDFPRRSGCHACVPLPRLCCVVPLSRRLRPSGTARRRRILLRGIHAPSSPLNAHELSSNYPYDVCIHFFFFRAQNRSCRIGLGKERGKRSPPIHRLLYYVTGSLRTYNMLNYRSPNVDMTRKKTRM